MIPDLIDGDATVWISDQNPPNKVLSFSRDVVRHDVLGRCDVEKQVLQITVITRVVEGRRASEENKQDDATAPYICLSSIIRCSLDNLRCSVMRATAGCGKLLANGLQCSHAKIDKLDRHGISVQQNVLGLEVAMVDIDTMAVNQGRDYLAEDMDGMDLNQSMLLVDIAEQLAAFDKLHDEVTESY